MALNRDEVRKRGIAARNALSEAERREKSDSVVNGIVAMPEYQNAKTVLLYKAVKGEVRLEKLESCNRENGGEKIFLYPLCVSDSEMIALHPSVDGAWRKGYAGITEPDPAKSTAYDAKDIDLVICPCTAFDEDLNRTGMGAGFYDRFLENCRADIIAAAFECQKTDSTLPAEHDIPMKAVVTEDKVYRRIYMRG